MEKFIPCRKCKKQTGSSVPEGYFMDPRTKLLKECPHHNTWRREVELERRLTSKGFQHDIPKDFSAYAGTKSRASLERLKGYVSLFSNPDTAKKAIPVFLYLFGQNGTQKTTLSQVTGRLITMAGYDCRYVLMKSLIDLLWESQRSEEAKAKIDAYMKCDVLIIDEAFSKDKLHLWASGAQIGYIDEFLRERVQAGKGCIFISNTPLEKIEDQGFSHSIQDLVLREVKKQDALLTFEDVYFDSIAVEQMPVKLF